MSHELERLLRDHKNHTMVYLETDEQGVISCHTCGKWITSWELATLDPDYELHKAVDAIQALTDEYFGPDWREISFNFDHIDNRIDEVSVWDDYRYDICSEHDEYSNFLEELEAAGDYIVLLLRDVKSFHRGGYPV